MKRNTACCHSPLGFSLISHSAKDNLSGVHTTHNGQGLIHQSLLKKMMHRFAHRPVSCGHFLNWYSLFPNDSNLYQTDIELASQWSHSGHDHCTVLPFLGNKVLLEHSYVLSLTCCLSIATFAL